MKTSSNNNNIESKNGMSQVVIDMSPKVKHQDGHGREVLADVHFRIDVQAYVNNFYTYTKEAREESEKACEAYYSEVVELLKSDGWTLRKEKYGVGDCPQMVKGTQYLYCHPQDISGQVNPADIEALEAKIKALTSCKYYKTDNYGDIIVTTSESDEKQLYRDTYADGLASIWQEVTTTKRSNLYKDKAEAEHCVRRRICIANRRADLNDIGTGSYNMRSPLLQFLMEEYDRLLQAGYIKEAEGQNGRTLCRWISKKEEKERAKAIREAEKAEKERKAQEWQEFLDREAEKQNSFAEGMRVKVPAASLERNRDKEVFVITRIRRKAADNGGNASLTVKSELTGVEKDINGSDVREILPALEPASEITASSEQGINVGTEVWTTIELHEEYGKRGKVVRRFFADHGVWCLDIEFEDGTTACYAEEYVTTEKPWAVMGAKCRHKYLNRDVVLTITAVGQYYGIKAESEDGKVKRCGLVRDFEPVEIVTEAEGVKVGDKVRHNKHEELATVTAIREAFVNRCDGYRYLYTLNFGQSVKGPFDVELNGGEFLREAFTLQNSGEITDENEAARALAGKEAHFIISDKDGRETLNHSFTFKDSFRNQANRIWIDIKEKGDVIGRWMMLKYDVIKELANTGRVVVSHPDGERHCITLA